MTEPTATPAPVVPLPPRPPGLVFHIVLVVPALAWLWSWSVPGFNFFLWMPAVLTLGVGALVWGIRLLIFAVSRVRGHVTSSGRSFMIAPVCGALLLGLVVADVPLEARWAASRAAFEDAVDDASDDPEYTSTERRRLGLYTVTYTYREGEAVIFYEKTGSFSNDAGFAYLPNGPFAELETGSFERPEFRHLGGPWYAWTASW